WHEHGRVRAQVVQAQSAHGSHKRGRSRPHGAALMQNPFDQFDAPQAPQPPGVILGRPKGPTPYEVQQDAQGNQRADAQLGISQRGEQRDIQTTALNNAEKLYSSYRQSQAVKDYGT